MNKVNPENVIYLENEKTSNKIIKNFIKIQVYENRTKVSKIKKYFGKYEKEYFPVYFDYKININNQYDINIILSKYDFYIFIEKPKSIRNQLKKYEKYIFVIFSVGIVLILIL